jgi:hypothetical protein
MALNTVMNQANKLLEARNFLHLGVNHYLMKFSTFFLIVIVIGLAVDKQMKDLDLQCQIPPSEDRTYVLDHCKQSNHYTILRYDPKDINISVMTSSQSTSTNPIITPIIVNLMYTKGAIWALTIFALINYTQFCLWPYLENNVIKTLTIHCHCQPGEQQNVANKAKTLAIDVLNFKRPVYFLKYIATTISAYILIIVQFMLLTYILNIHKNGFPTDAFQNYQLEGYLRSDPINEIFPSKVLCHIFYHANTMIIQHKVYACEMSLNKTLEIVHLVAFHLHIIFFMIILYDITLHLRLYQKKLKTDYIVVIDNFNVHEIKMIDENSKPLVIEGLKKHQIMLCHFIANNVSYKIYDALLAYLQNPILTKDKHEYLNENFTQPPSAPQHDGLRNVHRHQVNRNEDIEMNLV